jgi:hypothetical protein
VPISDDGIADWVTALPASEKDKFLTMVAEGEGAKVAHVIARREDDIRGVHGAGTRAADAVRERPSLSYEPQQAVAPWAGDSLGKSAYGFSATSAVPVL